MTFTVTNITHNDSMHWTYQPGMNVDPDNDSDGTAITVVKPASIPFFVTDLDGVNSSNSSKWRTTITIKLADGTGQPMVNVKVLGVWGYGNNANCTTDTNGLCSVTSNEFAGTSKDAISFTITGVEFDDVMRWAYQPDRNSDSDGDSNGTNIVMAKPLATPIFIGDLDGVKTVSSDKWRTSITMKVQDNAGNPIPKAKVFFAWSDGRTDDCTTENDGRCAVTSREVKQSEVPAMTFTVTDITHSDSMLWQYNATLNTDPDGDSTGTSITLMAQ
jgi:hypothetical protein